MIASVKDINKNNNNRRQITQYKNQRGWKRMKQNVIKVKFFLKITFMKILANNFRKMLTFINLNTIALAL